MRRKIKCQNSLQLIVISLLWIMLCFGVWFTASINLETTRGSITPNLGIYSVSLNSGYQKKNLPTFTEAFESTLDEIFFYSTFIGGSSGDNAQALAVDEQGNAFYFGNTSSSNFPLMNHYSSFNGPMDTYIVKLDTSGNLELSTYFGGTNVDSGMDIAVDSNGAYFITGYTWSSDFPLLNQIDSDNNGGNAESFVAKFNPDGSLNFSTYLGDIGWEFSQGIAVDSFGACYVTGSTSSSDFPVQNAFQSTLSGVEDVFVTKFNPDGTLNYSTFLGGSSYEIGNDIAVSDDGTCYVVGHTNSPDFPMLNSIDSSLNGFQDAFVTILNPDGTLNFSTYLGGGYDEIATAIALHSSQDFVITGTTFSTDFPVQGEFGIHFNDNGDGFVASFNSNKTINFSTCLGGIQTDEPFSIAVDEDGGCYISGHTSSSDFPLIDPFDPSFEGYQEGFIINYDYRGEMQFSSYLGGSSYDSCRDIELDAMGAIYLAGYTYSPDFPLYSPMDSTFNNQESFAMKMSYPIRDTDDDGLPDIWEISMGLNITNPADALWDEDNDFLLNFEEYLNGTDANNPDCDSDLLFDGNEVKVHHTNPLDEDTDNDGLYDGDEILSYGTNPLSTDSDGDLMPDGFEVIYHLDPTDSSDAEMDYDQDGMPNLWEYQMGLSTIHIQDAYWDKDQDGMPNLYEYQMGFNANNRNDAFEDADGDRLSNVDEYRKGTDPHNPDTDGDGFKDNLDYNSSSFFHPTGLVITVLSVVALPTLGIIIGVKIKKKMQKRIRFLANYVHCPDCGMQNERKSGVCVYCGKQIDAKKIRRKFDDLQGVSSKEISEQYCNKCGSQVVNGKCIKCNK